MARFPCRLNNAAQYAKNAMRRTCLNLSMNIINDYD